MGKLLTKDDRLPCPPYFCLRADGITCPDDECDYESGIYQGPVERWWLLAPADDDDPAGRAALSEGEQPK